MVYRTVTIRSRPGPIRSLTIRMPISEAILKVKMGDPIKNGIEERIAADQTEAPSGKAEPGGKGQPGDSE